MRRWQANSRGKEKGKDNAKKNAQSNDNKSEDGASGGPKHGEDQEHNPGCCLNRVGHEEKLGRQGAATALHDDDNVRDECDGDEGEGDGNDGDDALGIEEGLEVVGQALDLVAVLADESQGEGVDDEIAEHGPYADHQKGKQESLLEGRRLAIDVCPGIHLVRHGGCLLRDSFRLGWSVNPWAFKLESWKTYLDSVLKPSERGNKAGCCDFFKASHLR